MGWPDFVLIGAPKAGTTALHAALEQHPQLRLSRPKEPKFFLTGGRPPRRSQHRGPGDAHSRREWVWRADEYQHLFDDAPEGVKTGESTPFYLWDVAAHARLRDAVPNARLIALVRDPIDRAYSNWTHLRADGLEPEPDFRRACDLEERRARDGWAPFWRYLDLGRYGAQLEALYTHFAREQVLVVRYRQLVDEPAQTLDEVARFLGVQTGLVDAVPASNSRGWPGDTTFDTALRRAMRAGAVLGSFAPPRAWRVAQRPLLAGLHRGGGVRPPLAVDVRRELVARVADDVERLERLLGRSFQDWLGDSGRGTYAVRKSLAPSARDASQ